ncbi:translocation/assembly module TamB domain-containing protein [Brevundimonas sp. SL130]|uniref:translocation/assembly module TamB domain-containing protein n=1 Tax=Brevundimonas sp. SL130 TaxID=2995143 RepID=UPI00226D2E92|nr:translocation/assembly module TamB domain-containing protein [Brevundimonas sp. SL130]WAC60911.1 translocation/assembly module TamB domain-containing protein [Brevundimonas sp. SL130]
MTEAPPENTPDAVPPEQTAAAVRKTRSLLQRLAPIAGGVIGGLLVLLVIALLGGRMYIVSDAGRERVTGFVQGQKISRYGRINVYGLKGDLLDDFTLDRVTVTDRDGVWLDARNVRVDWSYWPLITRRFHATEISAGVIQLIRRPVLDAPSGKPGGPQPIDVDIDRFAAKVELLEGFSKEYGRWNLAGDVSLPRRGAKSATVNADSLNRPGDYLRLAAIFGGKLEETRVNLRANEAQGGPLAGSLGYSPDKPFSAVAVVNADMVHAKVQTGDFVPLTVDGRFGDNGSRLAGDLDFSGSDLFAPFIERVGRTARFGFTMTPTQDKAYQRVDWKLTADNIASEARGLIRMSDRSSPEGIQLEVQATSLSKLVGSDVAGPAAYSGLFKGDAQTWTLQGKATVLNANLASYRATRIAGPLNIQVKNGRIDLDGDIRANGGATEGLIGGLLGAAPRIQLEAARMKDGAILLETLDLQGQGLTLKGSGSRNLLGALGFRGEAQLTDASRVVSNAAGAFGGPIRASSPKTGAPWMLNFDGRGRNLTVGMDELNRLLGRTPRLQLTGKLNGGRIEVERGELTGAAGRAGAKGLIETNGRLGLALNWNARGPFAVGPVEIGGDMNGQGALTGTLSQPRVDLTAGFDKVTAGALTLTNADLVLSFRRGADASDGRITVASGSNYGPARASGNFFLGGQRIRLTDLDVNAGGVTAQGAVALSNSIPSSADLTFTARTGAFLTAGEANGRIRLTEGGGSESAILDVNGRNIRLAGQSWTVRTLDLDGRGTLDNLPFSLALDVGGGTPAQFNGTGVYSRRDAAQALTLRGGGRVREVAFTTRSPATLSLDGATRIAHLDLGVGSGVLLADLRQDARTAIIQADLTSVDLQTLSPQLRGKATGRVALRGAGDDLSGAANVTLQDVRSIDAPRGLAVDGRLDATLINNSLTLKATAADEGAVQASADLVLPVEASAAPLRLAIARQRPMSGAVSINGQIQPIWDLFLGGERSLAGQVTGQAAIAGTLAAPRLNGRFDLSQGSYREKSVGLVLGDLNLRTSFDDTVAQIETFTANDTAGGTVTGQGRVGLREGSGSTARLTLNRFRVIDNDIGEARASGPLTIVRGQDGNIQLSGEITVDEARIEPEVPGSTGIVSMDVVEINRPGGDAEETQTRRAGPQIGMDISLRSAGGKVRVSGRGLNVVLDVDARVRGTIAQPQLTGTANVVRGDYEFAGKRFIFDDTGRVTLSTDPKQIRLDLSATREDTSLTASINVTGTADQPKIALTSTPALPQDEILSQVLFGRSASQLSPFEAAQLAAGVAALAGGGGFDVIGNLRELAGLDRLSFGGEASAVTVAGGRYITDDVYLEVIGGGEGGAAVKVEWQPRRNLAISSQFGGQGDTSLSIRWRRESREPGQRADRRPNRN